MAVVFGALPQSFWLAQVQATHVPLGCGSSGIVSVEYIDWRGVGAKKTSQVRRCCFFQLAACFSFDLPSPVRSPPRLPQPEPPHCPHSACVLMVLSQVRAQERQKGEQWEGRESCCAKQVRMIRTRFRTWGVRIFALSYSEDLSQAAYLAADVALGVKDTVLGGARERSSAWGRGGRGGGRRHMVHHHSVAPSALLLVVTTAGHCALVGRAVYAVAGLGGRAIAFSSVLGPEKGLAFACTRAHLFGRMASRGRRWSEM